MASSRDSQAGYATVSALVLSMAIALVVAGSMAVAGAELAAARRELERVQQEGQFDSMHLLAAYQVATTPGATRVAWTESWNGGDYEILAEAETPKASAEQAAMVWNEETFRRLAVDPDETRRALAGFRSRERSDLLEMSASPSWRACILSLVSPIGASTEPISAPAAPASGEVDWRTGQVWRFRVRAADDWTDDRLVRWSGDGQAPLYVIDRQLYRLRESRPPCESIVQ